MHQKMMQQQEEIRLQKEESARLRAELVTSRRLAGSAKDDAELLKEAARIKGICLQEVSG